MKGNSNNLFGEYLDNILCAGSIRFPVAKFKRGAMSGVPKTEKVIFSCLQYINAPYDSIIDHTAVRREVLYDILI
jgi:hypothetical protein